MMLDTAEVRVLRIVTLSCTFAYETTYGFFGSFFPFNNKRKASSSAISCDGYLNPRFGHLHFIIDSRLRRLTLVAETELEHCGTFNRYRNMLSRTSSQKSMKACFKCQRTVFHGPCCFHVFNTARPSGVVDPVLTNVLRMHFTKCGKSQQKCSSLEESTVCATLHVMLPECAEKMYQMHETHRTGNKSVGGF